MSVLSPISITLFGLRPPSNERLEFFAYAASRITRRHCPGHLRDIRRQRGFVD
jgi:hypothetical protein